MKYTNARFQANQNGRWIDYYSRHNYLSEKNVKIMLKAFSRTVSEYPVRVILENWNTGSELIVYPSD